MSTLRTKKEKFLFYHRFGVEEYYVTPEELEARWTEAEQRAREAELRAREAENRAELLAARLREPGIEPE